MTKVKLRIKCSSVNLFGKTCNEDFVLTNVEDDNIDSAVQKFKQEAERHYSLNHNGDSKYRTVDDLMAYLEGEANQSEIKSELNRLFYSDATIKE